MEAKKLKFITTLPLRLAPLQKTTKFAKILKSCHRYIHTYIHTKRSKNLTVALKIVTSEYLMQRLTKKGIEK